MDSIQLNPEDINLDIITATLNLIKVEETEREILEEEEIHELYLSITQNL